MAKSAYKANFEAALRDVWFCDWLFGVLFTFKKLTRGSAALQKNFTSDQYISVHHVQVHVRTVWC